MYSTIVYGSNAEQLACQVHHSQKCRHNTPRSYAALWLPSNDFAALWLPSNDLGGFTDRMGAKGKRGILTKISPETMPSLRADGTTK